MKQKWSKMTKRLLSIAMSTILCCSTFHFVSPMLTYAIETGEEAIVKNGDFESGRAGYNVRSWSLTSMTASCTLETQHDWTANYTLQTEMEDGNKIAALQKKGAGYAAMTSQAFSVTSGQGYRLTYNYKVPYLEGVLETSDFQGIHVALQQLDKDGNQLSWSILNNTDSGKGQTGSTKWETVVQDFVADVNATSAVLYIKIGGTDDVKAKAVFDNIELVPYESTQVVNGDFESVTYEADGGRTGVMEGPACWKTVSVGGNMVEDTNDYQNNYIASIVEESSNKILKLEPKNGVTKGYTQVLSTYIPVPANVTYSIQYKLKISGNTNNGTLVRIAYYDAQKNYLGHKIGNTTKTTSNQWVTKTLSDSETVTPDNTAYVKVGFSISGAWNGTEGFLLYFDDVILNVAGENAEWTKETSMAGGVPRRDTQNYTSNYDIVQENAGTGHEEAWKIYISNNIGCRGGVTFYSQPIPVQGTEEYTTSFDLKIEDVDDAYVSGCYGASYVIRYLDNKGNQINAKEPKVLNGYPKGEQDWTGNIYTFTPPAEASSVQVGLVIGGEWNTCKDMKYYWDNIVLMTSERYEDFVKDPSITGSPLYEKTVLFVGDEVGGGMANVAENFSEMIVTDGCMSGAGFSQGLSATIAEQIIEHSGDNYEYVIISGGVQDAIANVPIGTLSDDSTYMNGAFDTTTFAGALEDTFRNVAENFDDIKVVYAFPNCSEMNGYYEVAKAASEKWNIEFIDFDVNTDFDNWNQIIEALETADMFDRDFIPDFSLENILLKRYSRFVQGGITPATNVEALKQLLVQVQNANMPNLEEEIENALKQYEAYRVSMCGATIAKADANQLRMIAASPTKTLPEKVKVQQMGILVLPVEDITPGNKNYNKDADLSVGNEFVMDITSTYSKAGAAYDAILSGNKVDPVKEYAAVAYIIYEVDQTEYVMYSQNDYVNTIGTQTVSDGVAVTSVYGIAKNMAELLVEEYEEQLNYDAIGGKKKISEIESATEETEVSLFDVFNMVSDNVKWLNEILRVGGAF